MVCAPRYVAFYTSILAGVACLVGLFATLHYWLESCDKDVLPDGSPETVTVATLPTIATNVTTVNGTTVPDVIAVTEDSPTESPRECSNHFHCYIVVACLFGYAFVPIIFGIIGSNRATKMPRLAIIMYHVQLYTGILALIGLVALPIIVSFTNVNVCITLKTDFVIWVVLLSAALALAVMLLIAIWMGWLYRRRLDAQNIKFTSGIPMN